MKKILIIAPLKIQSLIETFPAIHGLRKEYPGSEIHVLILESIAPYIEFLDCEIHTHKINKEDFNIFQLHKFAVNKNEIFNIDFSVDFEGSFLTSYLMYAFRSKVRLSVLENEWNPARLFQTKSKIITKNILELLSMKLAIPLENFKGFARGGDTIKKEERFISLFFDNANTINQQVERLAMFLSEFDMFSIGVYIYEINVGDAYILEEIYNKHLKDFKIGFRLGIESWELPKSLLISSVIVSNIPWVCTMSSYFGLPSILWGEENRVNYNNGFIVGPNSFVLKDFNSSVLNNKQMTLHEAVDVIFELFKVEKEKALQEEGQSKTENKFTLL